MFALMEEMGVEVAISAHSSVHSWYNEHKSGCPAELITFRE